ncbi:MAG: response regulator [Phycisphaeraceae bacterium]
MVEEKSTPVVTVVDDDPEVRRSLGRLIGSVKLDVTMFGSVADFRRDFDPSRPGCIVLDMRLPDSSGIDLLEELRSAAMTMPVIIITAYGDVASAVRAMHADALDFLEKPFNDQVFLGRVQQAIRLDAARREQQVEREDVRSRVAALTTRERQVMELVVMGKSNKMVAADLGISQKTAENYRAHLMSKMKAESLAELVRLAMRDQPKT